MVALFHYTIIYHLLASLAKDMTLTFLFSPFTYPKRKQKHNNESFWWQPQNMHSPLISFSAAQQSPSAQKVASRKASPFRGWSIAVLD